VNLGIFVMRRNYFKHFAGLIEHALARGDRVTLLCDHRGVNTPRRGPKAYEFPYLEEVPAFRNGTPRAAAFASLDELARLVHEARLHVLFAQAENPVLEALRLHPLAAGVLLAQLQCFPHPSIISAVHLFDVVYGFSAEWVQWSAEYVTHERALTREEHDRYRKDLGAIFVPVGFAELEQLRFIDRATVRARLGLPAGRPVVVYLPFPFASVRHHRDFWPGRIYGRGRLLQYASIALSGRTEYLPYPRNGWNDRRTAQSVREFCDRNGALLVVKSRMKNPVPRYVRRLADRVFYDEAYYPATILELLSAADLCVHFYSGALCEAAFAGVPNVCISPTPAEWPAYGRRMVVPALSTAPGCLFNYPGVTWSLGVGEFIARFGRSRLAEFRLDRARRHEFLRRYFAHVDVDVAARIVADLRRRLGEET